MVTTRTGNHPQWLVVAPSSSRYQAVVGSMLISRRLLGNDVVDLLEREGKVFHVPEDLALFAHSIHECDWITGDIKKQIVEIFICPIVHRSQRFHEIVKLLFWIEYNRRIYHSAPEHISSATAVLKKKLLHLSDQKLYTVNLICDEINCEITKRVQEGTFKESEDSNSFSGNISY